MNMNIGEIIKVLVEHCPNEAVAAFIATYGVFIIAIILIVVVLVRSIKKTGSFKDLSTAEIDQLKKTVKLITDNAAQIAVDNQKVSNEIKDEIRANNDSMMQLMISFGIANGMNYTDIMNIVNKAKDVYNVSKEQYNALEQEAKNKVESEALEQAKIEEELKQAAVAKVEALTSLKIGE